MGTSSDVVVSLGVRGFPHFLREAGRAIYGRISEPREGTLSRAQVTRYFEARSAARHAFSDVVDSSSRTYERLLTSAPVRMAVAASDAADGVLDYGCGRGGLQRLLRNLSPGHHYFGYDVDRYAIERLRANNASEFITVSPTLPDREFGLVFLVNVVVYTAETELEGVLAEAVGRLQSNGKLILVEPWPAWYWETRFNGLHLQMRGREDIAVRCRALGLSLVSRATLALFCWRGHPVVPIAWLGVWQPMGDSSSRS